MNAYRLDFITKNTGDISKNVELFQKKNFTYSDKNGDFQIPLNTSNFKLILLVIFY
jgi:hypothetical protein